MNLKKVFSALNGRLAKIQEALTTIHAQERELREAYEITARERDALLQAPPSRADAEAAIPELVRAMGENWRRTNGLAAIRHMAGGVVLTPQAEVSRQPGRLPDSLVYFGVMTPETIAAVMPGSLVEGLRSLVRSVEYDEGPPIADLLVLLAQADEKLGSLEAAHTELCDEAARLDPPVIIPLLPAVAERRAMEARRQAREAEAHERDHRANAGMHRRQHQAEAERERAREATAQLEATREHAGS